MSNARLRLTWDPDDQRQRVRRNAGMTLLVLTALLWGLSSAEPARPSVSKSEITTTTTAQTTKPVTPSLSVAAPDVVFGDQMVGTAVTQPVAFHNDSSLPFTTDAIAFTGGRAAAFEIALGDCTRVQPQASCSAVATFRPAEARDEKAQVVLLETSGARSGIVTLSGRGTAPLPMPPPPWHHVSFDASLIEVPVPDLARVIIRNSGEDEAAIGQIAIDDPASFRVDPGDCAKKQKLPPGDTCVVLVGGARDQNINVSSLRLFNANRKLEDVAAVINRMITPQQPAKDLRVPPAAVFTSSRAAVR